jgi:alkanesulfonate monooxygenase SsuD/methylene tetrahydromethanopterin reductase-like flavin-dependent oxidoreductase (luciferase family)
MSGGRIELGLGAGWFAAEHEAYGILFPDKRVGLLTEQLEIVTGMWGTQVGDDLAPWRALPADRRLGDAQARAVQAHAENPESSTDAQAVGRTSDDALVARRAERAVDTAGGDVADLIRDAFGMSVDHMGGTQLASKPQARFHDIDDDQSRQADHVGCHRRAQAETAAPCTTRDEPTAGVSELMAAPAQVWMPQPSGPAASIRAVAHCGILTR